MIIAITSPNGKTIAGHAGKCPGFLLYEVDERGVIQNKQRVKLAKDQVFSEFSGTLSQAGNHPLQGIKMLVTLSAGQGLRNRLSMDGIQVLITEETDPDTLIASI